MIYRPSTKWKCKVPRSKWLRTSSQQHINPSMRSLWDLQAQEARPTVILIFHLEMLTGEGHCHMASESSNGWMSIETFIQTAGPRKLPVHIKRDKLSHFLLIWVKKKLTAWDCVWEGNKYIWILFWRGGGTVWTRGLALARQSQYHLGHAPTHFYVLFFFFPEIGSQILLFVLPHRAGMTGVCHHAQPLVEMASPAQARLGEELVRHHLNK
jgi:hypothetical protein